jgi:23S rRNA (cytidine1920-2'-O)/16S rRNA (cytidine1409-2'-O)-methyltransferase
MIRLDKAMALRGLTRSRERAQTLISAGLVRVNGQKALKASLLVKDTCAIEVLGESIPYVSRGGLKMEAALTRFHLDVSGMLCLDVGASTGGFTDCLLQRGAARVIALDVGQGQMDASLRSDPRVELHEGVNARYLVAEQFPSPFDLIVVDVSFISLTLVLPALTPLLAPSSWLLALVKPQFEAGRVAVHPKGLLRDPRIRQAALNRVLQFGQETLRLTLRGVMRVPKIEGVKSIEYFALFQNSPPCTNGSRSS